MGKIVYSMSVSLDGFVNDAAGGIDWVIVDEELHQAFNDESRECAGFLYGRRMYELMTAYWPTALDDPAARPVERDFARIWVATPKYVASTTLREAGFGVRLLGPDVPADVERLRQASDRDLGVGGPGLAATLFEAGLIDEIRMYVNPVILGGGTPFLPAGMACRLRLVETRRFDAGVVLLRYVLA
jgi:dihydrofolate reductase